MWSCPGFPFLWMYSVTRVEGSVAVLAMVGGQNCAACNSDVPCGDI